MKKHTKESIEELIKYHEETIDAPNDTNKLTRLLHDSKEIFEFLKTERLRLEKEVSVLQKKDKILNIKNKSSNE